MSVNLKTQAMVFNHIPLPLPLHTDPTLHTLLMMFLPLGASA